MLREFEFASAVKCAVTKKRERRTKTAHTINYTLSKKAKNMLWESRFSAGEGGGHPPLPLPKTCSPKACNSISWLFQTKFCHISICFRTQFNAFSKQCHFFQTQNQTTRSQKANFYVLGSTCWGHFFCAQQMFENIPFFRCFQLVCPRPS